MNFVLDASVTLAWCFEDEGGDYALRVLDALRTSEAVAASLWPLEVANGLAVAERRGRLDAPAAARFMELVLALPIAVDPVSRASGLRSAHRMARTRGLSAYDAAYLELALRCGTPLATLDTRLREAAEAEGVRLFEG
ncbi:MAG: type II toxin-antitoxin system VapC family toxin [Gemmatimonadetes bacterium]|nr:type II toxin-antitoxin system VapC family toxin [Gemmatimonadota bacterium]